MRVVNIVPCFSISGILSSFSFWCYAQPVQCLNSSWSASCYGRNIHQRIQYMQYIYFCAIRLVFMPLLFVSFERVTFAQREKKNKIFFLCFRHFFPRCSRKTKMLLGVSTKQLHTVENCDLAHTLMEPNTHGHTKEKYVFFAHIEQFATRYKTDREKEKERE